jgi:hypothetical protein
VLPWPAWLGSVAVGSRPDAGALDLDGGERGLPLLLVGPVALTFAEAAVHGVPRTARHRPVADTPLPQS